MRQTRNSSFMERVKKSLTAPGKGDFLSGEYRVGRTIAPAGESKGYTSAKGGPLGPAGETGVTGRSTGTKVRPHGQKRAAKVFGTGGKNY